MDAGEFEADKCFEAGADIVTVLGVSNDETIEGCVRSAKKYGKKDHGGHDSGKRSRTKNNQN